MSMTICGFNATLLLSEMSSLALQKSAISTLVSKLLVDLHQSISSTQISVTDSPAVSAIDTVRVDLSCWEVFDTISIDLLGGGAENLRFNHEKQMPDGLKRLVIDLAAGKDLDCDGTVAAIMSAVDSRLCLVEEWPDKSRKANNRRASSAVGNLFITAEATQVLQNASLGRRVERSSKLTVVLLASTNSYSLSTPPAEAGKGSDRFIWISRSSNKYLFFDGAKPQNAKGNSVDHPLFCNLSIAAKMASLSGAAKALSSLRRIVQIRRQKAGSSIAGSCCSSSLLDDGSAKEDRDRGTGGRNDLLARNGDAIAGKAAAAVKSLRRGNDDRQRAQATSSEAAASTYTPYRDSLLTMMLKPTLSEDGNCFMAVVTTFSGVSNSGGEVSSFVSCCRSLQFISEISNLYNSIWSTDKVSAFSAVAARQLRGPAAIDAATLQSNTAPVLPPSTVHTAQAEELRPDRSVEGDGATGINIPDSESTTQDNMETLLKFNELHDQFQSELTAMYEHHMKCIEFLGIEISVKEIPRYLSSSPVRRNPRADHVPRRDADDSLDGDAATLRVDDGRASGRLSPGTQAGSTLSVGTGGSLLDGIGGVEASSGLEIAQLLRASDRSLVSSKSLSDTSKAVTNTTAAVRTPTRRDAGANHQHNTIKSRDSSDVDSPSHRSITKQRTIAASIPQSLSSQGLSPKAVSGSSGSGDPALDSPQRTPIIDPSVFPDPRTPMPKRGGSLPPILTQQRSSTKMVAKPLRSSGDVSLPDSSQREKDGPSRATLTWRGRGREESVRRDNAAETSDGGEPSHIDRSPVSGQQQAAADDCDAKKQQMVDNAQIIIDKKEFIAVTDPIRVNLVPEKEPPPCDSDGRLQQRRTTSAAHHPIDKDNDIAEKRLRNTHLVPLSGHPITTPAIDSHVENKPVPAAGSGSRWSSKSKASKADEAASADADSAGDGLSEGERKFLRFVSISDVAAAEKCLLRDHVDINVKNSFCRFPSPTALLSID